MSQTATQLGHPLRFDPHISRTLEITRAGTIGRPRTLSMEWSFGSDWSQSAATAGMVDAACLLLDSDPAAVYALASETGEPSIVKINLLVANGGIASLEAAWESDQVPTQRHLHLIGTDGEVLHRLEGENVLWRDQSRGPLPRPESLDALQARETAVGAPADDPRLNAIADAISESLARGEMVRIATEGSGS
jgi:predicted dehydrogenase